MKTSAAAKFSSRMEAVRRSLEEGGIETLPPTEGELQEIELAQIEVDPDQPRKNMADLSDLASSLKQHGLINPIVVRPVGRHRYMIVAGERRYRAHKLAGLRTIKCIIRTPDDQSRIELQLVENLHRKDLDPFEEAEGYSRLKTNHNYTDAQLAQRMSRSRSTVTEILGLLRIPSEVRAQCRGTDISRELLLQIAKQKTPEEMLAVLKDAQSGLPYKERRERARTGKARSSSTPKKPKTTYTVEEERMVVVLQSLNSTTTRERRIAALKAALKTEQSA